MLAIALLTGSHTIAHADQLPGMTFTGSGFLTLGLGTMLGGTKGEVSDYHCPCFVADYAQAGVYEDKSWQWKPDSKLGLQGTVAFDTLPLSLTGQLVARGARDGEVNLEWLYGSYTLNDKLSLQFGRKRLPMFYYSDTQDVGFALPWTHLPPQLYGWEAVNYNGVNLMYRDQWGDWSATMNLLAGNESRKESGYWKIYNGRENRTDVKWDAIVGGDLLLSKDWFETRLVYLQSKTSTKNINGYWDESTDSYDSASADSDYTPAARQQIYGVAFNADYGNWLARSEFIHINRPGMTFKDFAQIYAIGYRFGKWQPMFTRSNYRSSMVVDQGGDPDAAEAHYTNSLTLRYDLTTSSAIKIQYDNQHDRGGANWTPRYGDSRLLSVTFDMVF